LAKKKKDKKNRKRNAVYLVDNAQARRGLLGGLGDLLPSKRSEQFLLGAVLGAAAAYVLSDEELRGRIMKSGVKLYSGLVGGIAEMKEQVADIQAEIAAEESGLI